MTKLLPWKPVFRLVYYPYLKHFKWLLWKRVSISYLKFSTGSGIHYAVINLSCTVRNVGLVVKRSVCRAS